MPIIRWFLSSAASLLALTCVVVGFVYSPTASLAFSLSSLLVSLLISIERLSRTPIPADCAGRSTGSVMARTLAAGASATCGIMALIGFFALCGCASLALLSGLSVIAVSLAWSRRRRWHPARIIVVVDYRSTTPPTSGRRSTSPPTATPRVRTRRAQSATEVSGDPGLWAGLAAAAEESLATLIAELSTEQLCLAWRRSWLLVLDHRADPDAWDQAAELRRAYLQELERRDPVGFARWLGSGARAGSNPAKFVATSTDGPPNSDGAPSPTG